jgi:hypothetical protein
MQVFEEATFNRFSISRACSRNYTSQRNIGIGVNFYPDNHPYVSSDGSGLSPILSARNIALASPWRPQHFAAQRISHSP